MTVPQLTRRGRQEAKAGGLDGKDAVSRLIATIQQTSDSLDAQMRTLSLLVQRRLAFKGPPLLGVAAVLAIALLWAAASAYLGYRLGEVACVWPR